VSKRPFDARLRLNLFAMLRHANFHGLDLSAIVQRAVTDNCSDRQWLSSFNEVHS
jgi:hypothetical protein